MKPDDERHLDTALGQVLRVLDHLPFVSSLKREVMTLRSALYERRAPRFLVAGGPHSGKSSLGNALLGKEALPLVPGAEDAPWVRIDAEGALMDWLEVTLGREVPGETSLDRSLGEEHPDFVILVFAPSDLDSGLTALIQQATHLLQRVAKMGEAKPQVIAILSRVDEIPPASADAHYSEAKINAIEVGRQRLDKALADEGLVVNGVFPVAVEVHARHDFGIERVAEAICDSLPDQALLECARALVHATRARQKLAARIVHSCSTLALTVGLAPVPLSDVVVIAPLQVVMVSAVAHLGGRPWNRNAVFEWMASMGLIGGASVGLRWTAQQLVKLIPGAGSLVSAGVAGAGTAAMGRSAIAYFLRDGPEPSLGPG